MDNYKLRFVPLGGVVGVTKNMYLYELYKNDVLQDIVIVDCGIGFPKEKELGVDFVIPDISYLKGKTDKIRAVLLSHAHEDHISALPYHFKALGRPPVYTSRLTALFVENKFKETTENIRVNQIDYSKEYTFGDFKVGFIHVTHSVPDTLHMVIKTPLGDIYHGTDFKFDLTPPYEKAPDFYKITKAGHDGVLCLMSDCLGAEREGLTLSESIVGQTFEDEMRKTRGKFVMTTFSSNISRIRQCVEAAIKFNRKIVFLGRSMKENTKIATSINYLPIPHDFLIKDDDVMRLPPNKICLIVAGSQGQYNSALAKLADNLNKRIKLKSGDKVFISSDPIPGNENEVYDIVESFAAKGVEVVYSDTHEQLHASGHGNSEDLKFLIRFTNPKYFIPIGGTLRHQMQYQKLAVQLGHKKETVFLLNEGETMWFEKGGPHRGDTVETKTIYVDAYGVGDVGTVVLGDRQTLSKEGIVVVILPLDMNFNLTMKPKILSKGFVFEKNEIDLFTGAERVVETILKPKGDKAFDLEIIKKQITFELEDFFYKERGRRPLLIVDAIQI